MDFKLRISSLFVVCLLVANGLADDHLEDEEACMQNVMDCTKDMQQALQKGGMSSSDIDKLLSFSDGAGPFQKRYCSAIGDFDINPTLECMSKEAEKCKPKKNDTGMKDHDGGKMGPGGDGRMRPGDHKEPEIMRALKTVFMYMCDEKCEDLTTLATDLDKCFLNNTELEKAGADIESGKATDENCKTFADETGNCLKRANCCPLVMEVIHEMEEGDKTMKDSCPGMDKRLNEICPRDDDKRKKGGDGVSGAVSQMSMTTVVASVIMIAIGLIGV